MADGEIRQVVYLIGAGASHGCVQAAGSQHGILMGDLNIELSDEAGDLIKESKYESHDELKDLVNEIVTEDMDIEQVITFLDQSPSAIHRSFADDLRAIFEDVLKKKLSDIDEELDGSPTNLYEVLLDIHQHPSFNEELVGIMTLNYDQYLEHAIESISEHCVDFGVEVRGHECDDTPIPLLKLHGSFGWNDTWPITISNGESSSNGESLGISESSLWIPPGIQKAKDQYPFNIIWGRAREMLDCDVVRIIGCRLGPNDWDLISLLFSTRRTNVHDGEYSIEVINSPTTTQSMSEEFPYLNLCSPLDLENIGPDLVSEFLGGSPRPVEALSKNQKKILMERTEEESNWFQLWLDHMVDFIREEHGTLETPNEHIETFYQES